VEQRKSSVEMDDRMWMYLYGSKWIAYRVLGNGYLSFKKKKTKELGGGRGEFFFFFFFSFLRNHVNDGDEHDITIS